MVLVVAPVTLALHGAQLGELLFPIAQHMGLDAAQLRHLTNREVALDWYGGQRLAHGDALTRRKR